MAEVFRAREPRSAGEPRTVVLKRMLPHVAAQPGSHRMFEEEARLASFVHHPNVVEVFGIEYDGELPHLVLEYVPGVDLWQLTRQLMREGHPMRVPLAVIVMRDLLAALHAVHEARDTPGDPLGIVHRDVSPSNVLLSVHGQAKLGDFGIARRIEESYHHGLGGRKGKLGYLAPEQVTGEPVDRRGDVFSAGVIAAELLMGRPLFTGGSELAILLAIRDANIQPFLESAHGLPEELQRTITDALARSPADRIETAEAFRERLTPFAEGEEDALRRELGAWVRECAGHGKSAEGPAAPLAEANEATPVRSEQAEELAASTAGTHRQPTPTTADIPPLEFHIHSAEGRSFGPWTYARVVEAIATGELAGEDRVSMDGTAFRSVREVPDLARHLPPSVGTPVTREAEAAPKEPDARMSLEDGQLVAALARSALHEETGLWLCEHHGVRKEVYVQQGSPEFVTSNVASELLGEVLVHRGTIARHELDMALAVMPRFDGRLGDTLVALGLTDPVTLFQQIARQVREKLLDLFVWRAGSASLYRGVPPPSTGFPLGIDPWALLDEGIGRRIDEGLEQALFEQYLQRSVERAPLDHGEDKLPAVAAAIREAAGEPTPLKQMAERHASAEDPKQGYRAIVLLLHLGGLRWAGE